jgi:hypothetical protein
MGIRKKSDNAGEEYAQQQMDALVKLNSAWYALQQTLKNGDGPCDPELLIDAESLREAAEAFSQFVQLRASTMSSGSTLTELDE